MCNFCPVVEKISFASFSLIILLWKLRFHWLLQVFLWLFFWNNYVAIIHTSFAHLDTVLFLQLYNKGSAAPLVSYNLISFSKNLWFYQYFLLSVYNKSFVAQWSCIFLCKDLFYIWQVFPLGNAVCKISRSKCKFFIKKEYFFCLKSLFYSQSWSQSWFMSTLMVIGRGGERFSPMSQTHIRKWRYVTAKWQLGSIKSPYLEHRPGLSLSLRR